MKHIFNNTVKIIIVPFLMLFFLLSFPMCIGRQTANIEKAKALYENGNVKLTSADYYGAIEDYDQAIKLNPELTDAYSNRGVAKDSIADFLGALNDYSTAIELDPENSYLYYIRGIARWKLGFTDSGCQDIVKAAELGYEEAFNMMRELCTM